MLLLLWSEFWWEDEYEWIKDDVERLELRESSLGFWFEFIALKRVDNLVG